MLHPENRLTLIDAMRPPAGFRFESAMAVTFTLDLKALLAAPAALTLTGHATGVGGESGDDRLEPVEFVHALRSHADRLTVFGQAGEIALPPSRRAFAFLERAILPVSAPRGGVVHPKVWVIRYETAEDPARRQAVEPRLRVLVSSRNLTFDASWDTMVRFDEASAAAGMSLQPLGELFTGLLNHCSVDVTQDHRMRVQSLAASLHDALFALPAGVDDLKVHVLGLEPKPSPLPGCAERSLIISPFVSDGFFAGVHAAKIDEFVSRPESFDGLAEASLSKMDKIHTFEDNGLLDRGGEEAMSPFDPGRPLAGLHAKVFAFENGRQANLFLGSANATGAAFRRNVEILVELVGHTAVLGIDRLCGADDDQSLRDLFHDYRGPSPPAEPNGESESLLDRARRSIAELDFEGEVEPSGADWAVTYRTTEPVRAPEGLTIGCWPLPVIGQRRDVPVGRPLRQHFETSLENVSGFLAFELAHEDTLSSFVVPVRLVGVPEQRDRLLLRMLIGNAERFFRYLMALLEEDSSEFTLLDTIERISNEPVTSDGGDFMSLPVLEKLLRTMRRDPAKLAGLHPLVSDLADDDALPPGFAELWRMIHDVATAGEPGQ
ncbi:MAG: hypothetical protein F4110_05030 [Acidimicrobiaceae bacterium]|nr:hypothetical protein [Acidimicrobiaceae bacterium]MYE97613.1 hypothetical protein [Acidimicrobiaceae bacterium]MYI53335.1 hypothetical protein [Acidimicrobiaceae bacterium]MYJ81459.1 hypothetical protein [Acidimicrobiaceae bacterium]